MSRNAPFCATNLKRWPRLGSALGIFVAALLQSDAGSQAVSDPVARSRVVVVKDPDATESFRPRENRMRPMIDRGLTNLTQTASAAAAWRSLITTQDTVGIKVYSSPGPDAGTRPAVVAALIETLLEAKIPPGNILIWDRQKADLRRAGFVALGQRYSVRVEGSANSSYDEETFYAPERPVLGQLIWGDVEFGRKGEGVGRRSFVSRLVSKEMTKIVLVTPLLNHNTLGVCGHLYSLALGSVDNALRFENDLFRLSTAVPEIYGLPVLNDRVVLCITDALVCQYEGERSGLLHYSAPINELRFSKDPVALDLLSLRDLERERLAVGFAPTRGQIMTNQVELLNNAALLEIGVSDLENIRVERTP